MVCQSVHARVNASFNGGYRYIPHERVPIGTLCEGTFLPGRGAAPSAQTPLPGFLQMAYPSARPTPETSPVGTPHRGNFQAHTNLLCLLHLSIDGNREFNNRLFILTPFFDTSTKRAELLRTRLFLRSEGDSFFASLRKRYAITNPEGFSSTLITQKSRALANSTLFAE
jgi:hypothetical protein